MQPDCSLLGHPEVFVVGDLMTLDGLPGVAEVAMQSGAHAARLILKRIKTVATMAPARRSATATSARWPRSRASGGWPRSGRFA